MYLFYNLEAWRAILTYSPLRPFLTNPLWLSGAQHFVPKGESTITLKTQLDNSMDHSKWLAVLEGRFDFHSFALQLLWCTALGNTEGRGEVTEGMFNDYWMHHDSQQAEENDIVQPEAMLGAHPC